MDGRRVLVTGGAGLLGSYLVERLSRHNLVTVLDDLSTGTPRNLRAVEAQLRVVRGSLLDPKALAEALSDQDIVYHLAAKTSVPESFARPGDYWRTNVEGTVEVLKASADAEVDRLVFMSSAAVYGPSEVLPNRETMATDPGSPYAATKVAGEAACLEAARERGLETVILRLFNTYGPRQDPDAPYAAVIAKFCAAVAEGRGLEIFGDGEQTRDFLYASDVAEALELAAERPVAGQIVNVGSGEGVTVNEVARLLAEIGDEPVHIERRGPRPGDIRHSRADVTRARERLGFAPRMPLREGMGRTLASQRARLATA